MAIRLHGLGLALLICLRLEASLQALPDQLPQFILSSDSEVFWGYSNGDVFILNRSGQVIETWTLALGAPNIVHRAADGSFIFGFHQGEEGTLLVRYNPQLRLEIQRVLLKHRVLRFLPSQHLSRVLVLVVGKPNLMLWDTEQSSVQAILPPNGGPVIFGYLGERGNTVMTLSNLGVVHYLDVQTAESRHHLVLPQTGVAQLISPGRTRLAVASARQLTVFDRLSAAKVWQRELTTPHEWFSNAQGAFYSREIQNPNKLFIWFWQDEDGLLAQEVTLDITNPNLFFLNGSEFFAVGRNACRYFDGVRLQPWGPESRLSYMPFPTQGSNSAFQILDGSSPRILSRWGELLFQARSPIRDHRLEELEWIQFEDLTLIALDPAEQRLVWRGRANLFAPRGRTSVFVWSRTAPRQLTQNFFDRRETEVIPLRVEEVRALEFQVGEESLFLLVSQRSASQTRYELWRLTLPRFEPQILWSRESFIPVQMVQDVQRRLVLFPINNAYLVYTEGSIFFVNQPRPIEAVRPIPLNQVYQAQLWVRYNDGGLAWVETSTGRILKLEYRLTNALEVWFEDRGEGLEVTLGQQFFRPASVLALGPEVSHFGAKADMPILLPPHLLFNEIRKLFQDESQTKVQPKSEPESHNEQMLNQSVVGQETQPLVNSAPASEATGE